MTFYKALYIGPKTKAFTPGEVYDVVLAESKTQIEMRQYRQLNNKTVHSSVENLLNCWGLMLPTKINNTPQ